MSKRQDSKKKEPEEPKVEKEAKPESKAITPIPNEVFVAMDKADEDQIVSELKGELDYAKDLVYQVNFGAGRGIVTALSYKGIKEAIHRTVFGAGQQYEIKAGYPMRVDKPDEDSIMIMMVIRNPVSGEEFAGAAQCEKDDKFALAKATSKAQRNALKSFIPESISAQVVAEVLARGKAKVIPMQKVSQAPTVLPTLPTATAQPQATSQQAVGTPQKRKDDDWL